MSLILLIVAMIIYISFVKYDEAFLIRKYEIKDRVFTQRIWPPIIEETSSKSLARKYKQHIILIICETKVQFETLKKNILNNLKTEAKVYKVIPTKNNNSNIRLINNADAMRIHRHKCAWNECVLRKRPCIVVDSYDNIDTNKLRRYLDDKITNKADITQIQTCSTLDPLGYSRLRSYVAPFCTSAYYLNQDTAAWLLRHTKDIDTPLEQAMSNAVAKQKLVRFSTYQ